MTTPNSTPAAAGTKQVAAPQKNIVDTVAGRVRDFIANGELHLPADYSPENALKAAWLVLQETVDKDKNPVLKSCSQESISLSLLDMIVLGLNPIKKQCYFIAYGKKMTCQRSYFGAMAMAQRLNPNIADFAYEVVYEGDKVEYSIVRGKKVITGHVQNLENIKDDKIIGAYAMTIGHNGEVMATELMTFDQIKKSWRQSRNNPFDSNGNIKPDSTHGKFPRAMALRTVINKLCNPIINASSDVNLMIKQAAARADEIATEVAFEEELAANANTGEVIDIHPEPVGDQAEPPHGDPGPVEPPRCPNF